MGFRANMTQFDIDQMEQQRQQRIFDMLGKQVMDTIKTARAEEKAKEQNALVQKAQNDKLKLELAKAGVNPSILDQQEQRPSLMGKLSGGGETMSVPPRARMEDREAMLQEPPQAMEQGIAPQPVQEPQAIDPYQAIAQAQKQKLDLALEDKRKRSELLDRQLEEYTKPYEETKAGKTYVKKQKLQEKFRPIKADERKAATFAARVEEAEQNFSELAKKGFNRASTEAAGEALLPEIMKGEDLKRQEQAERNFINAILRRESGAAIAPSEFTSAEKQYFPRIGDTPKVLEQKRKNRETALAGLKAEAGERAIGQIKQQKTNISKDEMSEAEKWARSNPNDPRAATILGIIGK